MVISFHRSILLGSYRRLKSEVVGDFIEKFAFVEKNDPLREDFQNSVPKGVIATKIHILCANFLKFSRPEIGKVVRYSRHKKKQNFGSLSRCPFCAARAQNLSQPAANSVLKVPQISSKSVPFRRSYIAERVNTVQRIAGLRSDEANDDRTRNLRLCITAVSRATRMTVVADQAAHHTSLNNYNAISRPGLGAHRVLTNL